MSNIKHPDVPAASAGSTPTTSPSHPPLIPPLAQIGALLIIGSSWLSYTFCGALEQLWSKNRKCAELGMATMAFSSLFVATILLLNEWPVFGRTFRRFAH